MTPAGTSNELDVQNGWEENTHTHTPRGGGFSLKSIPLVTGYTTHRHIGKKISGESPSNKLHKIEASNLEIPGIRTPGI